MFHITRVQFTTMINKYAVSIFYIFENKSLCQNFH